ncbi:UxaA family hydrolase [Gynurincola endophyticus]|uniref:UxaA family hydrolase n=1 Tax=Gynurincola endophyticus TaxID=2479004 RepID=UPI000F8EBF30|nr:altronate dehydratase family protein [Gynurincola endophyticus]
MKNKVLKVHPADDVIVALADLKKGEVVSYQGTDYTLYEDIAAKHKFVVKDFAEGEPLKMYGVLIGKAKLPIPKGARISTENLKHAAEGFELKVERRTDWHTPDIAKWENATFKGFHRSNGDVGTGNYWLIVPMVFCENRNVEVLKEALLDELGYGRTKKYNHYTQKLVEAYKNGISIETIPFQTAENQYTKNPLFPNVDGIKFLTHDGGCGGIRQDAQALCGLLAGYITHSNVAGATVLSLGCQNAQVSMLQAEIEKRQPGFDRPVHYLEQQKIGTELDLIAQAIQLTFKGLVDADKITRQSAPLSKLTIGLECGGSDGFSGISANPAIGYTSDILVALGGKVILSEFPELCGVEQELSDRCVEIGNAERFIDLMRTYNARAQAVGSGFDMNPSPGNIKDGLITDAIKSAGAAKKGGTSPVVDVLDYPELVKQPGLNLLCTPGNDVESTTAEVASGANVVLFTTGLGTPTGNPITPVVKISSNTALYKRMPDIIDINAGEIIDGNETIEECGARILDYIISVASGDTTVHAVRHGQDDFIPWKRGVSL